MAYKQERLSLAKYDYPALENDLIEAQIKSFKLFIKEGIEDLFLEIDSIDDYTGEAWRLNFESVEWDKPKLTFSQAMKLGLSYDQPLYVNVRLTNKKTGEIKKQKIFVVDMPVMTDRGTFVISGNERVVVMQITRAEGVLFYETKASSHSSGFLYGAKLMPTRGRWFDFEVNRHGVMSVKLLDKRPKIFLTTLLRAIGYSTDEELKRVLAEYDTGEIKYLENTLRRDPAKSREEALLDIYRKLRPEDSISLEASEEFVHSLLFDKRRFYLGRIGRYKLNKKLGIDSPISPENYVLHKEDVLEIVRAVIRLNVGTLAPDDIDHLSNRRIKGVGELIADHMRVGVSRMEKNIRDRMGTYGTDELITPSVIINTRPIIASINQFFGSSQVSRYMDQENILSEIETKRRITAGGPGGLTKERATFSVRDVHASSYSRVCPVTTPEGPSIGIVSHLSVYARINDYGFIEAPYFKVLSNENLVKYTDQDFELLIGKVLRENVEDLKANVLAKKGTKITKTLLDSFKKHDVKEIKVEQEITDKIVYFDPDDEQEYKIAVSTVRNGNKIEEETVFVRHQGGYRRVPKDEVEYIDVNPGQIAGVGLSLVPFSQHDDPTRTLMASNMQRQAVPLLFPEAPIVGTGFEEIIARASKRAVYAEEDGEIMYADASRLVVNYKKIGEKIYHLEKYIRTNQNTTFSQVTRVRPQQKVKKGEILIDGPGMDNGELALGRNLTAAFMMYEGLNYEDGIVLSERIVREDVLTSVHIKEYIQDIRDTKLGKEQITADIPNVGQYLLRNLDDEGIVRIGANVDSRDILVGIIAPKGEVELTAEEKLLRAIFGEYARDVRDNSLRLPHGDKGIVIGVQLLDKDKGDKLNPGVLKQVKVWVAKTQKVSVGDKLTGLHGDKGVISAILPESDMPYLEDGTPVDIVLSPMFVKRMNVGQVKEMNVGSQASKLGIKVKVPPFTPIDDEVLEKMLKQKGIDWSEKVTLFDGRTGEPFDKKVAVGPRYIVRLNHLSSDKIHARSTGPYTVVTQQPLGGKAQFGGQRFGEMEVWALQAHAVPTVLHEMLTIKSDDVMGRASAYKSIIQGLPIDPPTMPESFKVFLSELRALGINLDMIEDEEDAIEEENESDEIEDDEFAEQGIEASAKVIKSEEEEFSLEEDEVVIDETEALANDPNFEIEEKQDL